MNRETQVCEIQEDAGDIRAALVAQMYNKAVSCLNAAVQAIHNKNIETRWKNNRQAQEIIDHLFRMLDMDKGGEIASNLEALYTYMLLRLPDVDIKNETRAAEEVIELLEPLRASWAELARNQVAFRNDLPEIGTIAAAVATFWLAMCALMAITILIGFWPTYFGPLISGSLAKQPIIHFHGGVFMGWIALFTTQAVLASTGRIALHRKVGKVGIAYGVLIVVVGLATTFNQLANGIAAGEAEAARDPWARVRLPRPPRAPGRARGGRRTRRAPASRAVYTKIAPKGLFR